MGDNVVEMKNHVLGTFEGKCADAVVTNENGLDITREVWEHLFDSEDFKTGIENGWYLGCLGHPDDPCDQNHKDACIIMRDCWIDDKGEVYGKFDLIDTPVGKVVKTFIDVGVVFGLSVRGAGDIYNNSVDPDTFCFRGFDLVIFPAYKDAIPKFTQIAASTNDKDRIKYKKICACVKSEIDNIDSKQSLDIIQTQFPANSDMYSEIEDKKNSIIVDNIDNDIENEKGYIQFLQDKISSMTSIYIDKLKEFDACKQELADTKDKLLTMTEEVNCCNTKLDKIEKIHNDLGEEQTRVEREKEKELSSVISSNKHLKRINDKLKQDNSHLVEMIKAKDDKVAKLTNVNLNLNQKITSSKDLIVEKDSIIASLKSDIAETVNKSVIKEQKLSNCDEDIKELTNDLNSALKVIEGYQDEYLRLYSSLVCNDPTDLSIDSMTDVHTLKRMIDSATNSCNIPCNPKIENDFIIDDDSDLVTV